MRLSPTPAPAIRLSDLAPTGALLRLPRPDRRNNPHKTPSRLRRHVGYCNNPPPCPDNGR